MSDDYELCTVREYFDKKYYLSMYPDVGSREVEPVFHYCEYGWREGRNPSAEFDTTFYLERYDDIRAAGINPFYHYIVAGKSEGRIARNRSGALKYRLAHARPQREVVKDWVIEIIPPANDAEEKAAALLIERRPTVVSVSHDDYRVNFGGVQNVIADEQGELSDEVNYIHLSPAQPLPKLSEETDEFIFSVRINGAEAGRLDFDQLQRLLGRMVTSQGAPRWIIHHLMGHSPEILTRLIESQPSGKIFFWAHDFFAACESYALLRNDIVYCAGPPPDSMACGICVHGRERGEHMARIRGLLDTLSPTIVAPSRAALRVWERTTGCRFESVVVNPGELFVSAGEQRPEPRLPLRVGFIGTRSFHKGWVSFEDLALALAGDRRYRFYAFSSEAEGAHGSRIEHVPVRVTSEDRNAMVDALLIHGIDVVVSWSIWPETFCFTVHEAIAAGAFIVARFGEGNVGDAIKQFARDCSVELSSDADLNHLFKSGKLVTIVRDSPRRYGALVPSMGSADLIDTDPMAELSGGIA
ncbi:glycosyltransferase family protein [Roseixanthobacter pseudopolyaromaticivorans]|uniref:hypothetical protein n=1 Tax=Xanthobacteraceae TaxID=335928 RepID=UPI003728A3A4